MSGSALTPFNYIPENSLATPGLWNSVFSTLSQNIAEANTLSVLSGGLSLGTQGLTITVPSSTTDYIFLNDSTNLRSSYAIGSFNSGTADGLNIWDASGQTMIVSFSKQSVRFFQNIVGSVFDTGGALTGTLNAATFGVGSDSTESRIQATINAAALAGTPRVYLPGNFYPYSASSISFIYTVQMVREGGNYAVCDVQAYGANPNQTNVNSTTSAIQEAIRSAISQDRIVYFPAGTYSVKTLSYYSGSVLQGDAITASGSPPVQLYQSSASGPIFQPADPTKTTADFVFENLFLSSFGNTNNGGGIDCQNTVRFFIHRMAFSGTSSFVIRVVGGTAAGQAGFGTIDNCIFSALPNAQTILMLVSTATDQPDGVLFTNNYCSVSNATVVASLSSFTRGVDTFTMVGNRFESGGTDFSILTGYFSKAKVIGNRFETTNSTGTIRTALNPSSVGGTQPCALFLGNSWEAPGGFVRNDNGFVRSPFVLDDETGSVYRNEWGDGTATNPAMSYRSESSLGWYRSGTSVMGLSYGQLALVAGSAIQPSLTFSSESSLGWYRSAASGMALSYGTLTLPGGGSFLLLDTGAPAMPGRFWQAGGILNLSANRNMAFAQDSNTKASWLLTFNANPGSGSKTIIAYNAPGGGGTNILSLDSIGNLEVGDGTAKLPSHGFLSETSLGLYRSATSTIALSYGTFDFTGGGAVTSIASLKIKSGANNSCGTAVLGSNGSVNVANTYVAAGDLIFLTDQTPGGTLGDLELGGIRAGSGFTIQSTSVTDTSTVGWLIIRPT